MKKVLFCLLTAAILLFQACTKEHGSSLNPDGVNKSSVNTDTGGAMDPNGGKKN